MQSPSGSRNALGGTAENGNLGNFEAVENNDTSFAPKQCLYEKVAVDRADSGNWQKFEATFRHGTVFAPMQ